MQTVQEILDDLIVMHKEGAACEWRGYQLCRCELADIIRLLVKYELKQAQKR